MVKTKNNNKQFDKLPKTNMLSWFHGEKEDKINEKYIRSHKDKKFKKRIKKSVLVWDGKVLKIVEQ